LKAAQRRPGETATETELKQLPKLAVLPARQ